MSETTYSLTLTAEQTAIWHGADDRASSALEREIRAAAKDAARAAGTDEVLLDLTDSDGIQLRHDRLEA